MKNLQTRDLTISLSVELLEKAEDIAAKRSASVSGLIATLLQTLVDEDSRYEIAAASAIARMDRGLPMGGGRLVTRDELHER